MSEYHHVHPHRHADRGAHDHYHGHRGHPPAARRTPVPWPHWFASHPHVHSDPADAASLAAPPAADG